MSSFLWVEDFEDGKQPCRELAHSIFGDILDVRRDDFPETWQELRDYLSTQDIVLKTNFDEALKFIHEDELLDKVDYFMLDIDLPFDGISPPSKRAREILEEWYPAVDSAERKAGTENDPKFRIRPFAGYHLYIELVMELGIPRDRVIFCSNHGEFLLDDDLQKDGNFKDAREKDSDLKDAFNLAKIKRPTIYEKDDPRIQKWLKQQRTNHYSRLRRQVLNLCDFVRGKLDESSTGKPNFLRFRDFPGSATSDFDESAAKEWIENIPIYLPAVVSDTDSHRQHVLRNFVRYVTYHWDRFSADKKNLAQWKNLTGHDWNSEDSWCRASCSSLKLARNAFSHSPNTPIRIEEVDAAFIFLLCLRTVFNMGIFSEGLLPSERSLLGLVGSSTEWPVDRELEQMLKNMESGLVSITKEANLLAENEEGKPYDATELIRNLQDERSAEFEKSPMRFIRQMLWLQLLTWPKVPFKKNLAAVKNSPEKGLMKIALTDLRRENPAN